MVNSSQQEGMMVTLTQRFERQRLPRIMAIKEYVDQGRTLSDYDREFLEVVMRDARTNIRHVEDIPECRHLFMQLVHLYKQIIDRAMANEKSACL